MIRCDKRLIYCFVFFCSLFSVLLAWPGSPVNAATKALVFTGFEAVALYPDLAEDLSLPREQQGLVVIGVFQGSPAEKAGIREGDLIIKVQAVKGKAVVVKDIGNYNTAVNAISSAKPIIFTVRQKDQELTVQLIRSSDKFGPLIQPPTEAKPSTIKVAADKSGDFRTIEGAMLCAGSGDTILLSAGQYPFVNIGRDHLSVSSLNPQSPAVLAGVKINGVTGTKLEGLTFVSSTSGSGAGITGFGNQTTVSNCQIRGFSYGIDIHGTDLILDGNTFKENGLAVYIDANDSSLKIRHNLISKNSGGIWVGGQVEISNNTIIENRVSSVEFISRLFKSQDVTGVGIKITTPGSRGLVFNNIVAFNNVGCLSAPNTQVTLEYNDFFQQTIEQTTLKTGWALNDNHANIPACNSNFLSQINHVCQQSNGNYYDTFTPVLLFQPSATNISADPLFADSMKSDYRLANDSPLIEKGRGNSYIGAYPPIVPKQEVETQNKPLFGISARPLTDLDRQTLGLASQNGLWVTEVKKNSLAENLQIKVDDVILEVNGAAFKDNGEFKRIITTTTITTVKVFRGGTEIILTVPTEF
jgi:hypothetical protein